jgi:hypothetical protein
MTTPAPGPRPPLRTREAVSTGLGHAEAAGEFSVADLQAVLGVEAVVVVRELARSNRAQADSRGSYRGW